MAGDGEREDAVEGELPYQLWRFARREKEFCMDGRGRGVTETVLLPGVETVLEVSRETLLPPAEDSRLERLSLYR